MHKPDFLVLRRNSVSLVEVKREDRRCIFRRRSRIDISEVSRDVALPSCRGSRQGLWNLVWDHEHRGINRAPVVRNLE